MKGEAKKITPNQLHLLEEQTNRAYWFEFKDHKIWEHEAPYFYVVIQEAVHYNGSEKTSRPTLHTYAISTWQEMTLSTKAAKTKYAGLNPLAGLTTEVVHDPVKYFKDTETAKAKPKKTEEPFILTLEMIQDADLTKAKEYYKKVFGKSAGRMNEEGIREKLVDSVNEDDK